MTSIKDRLPSAITTERLALRTPTHDHVAAIARLANNRNVHRWLSRLPFPYSEDDARFFIDTIVAGPTERPYAIEHAEEFVGVVGLSFEAGTVPELGYWLGEPYWGQGLATEAAAALVAAARAAGATELKARALVANSGSRNVLSKVGFVEIGEAVEAKDNLAGQRMVLMRLDFPR